MEILVLLLIAGGATGLWLWLRPGDKPAASTVADDWQGVSREARRHDRGSQAGSREPAPAMPTLTDLAPHLAKVEAGEGAPTPRQVEAVRGIGMAGDPSALTFAQASALLSARRYSEGVIHSLIGTMHGYGNERLIEANLTAFIIRDDKLRARAVAWNARSHARGSGDVPRPRRDEHFARVEAEASRLFAVCHNSRAS